MSDDIVLEAVRGVGDRWLADLSFRGKSYQMVFQADYADKLRAAGESPFNHTAEGCEVEGLVERVRRGERLTLPQRVVPGPDHPRRLSIRDPRWNPPPLKEAWFVGVERSSKRRWLARLRLDGRDDVYEVDILSDGGLDEIRTPENPSFSTYKYDLTSMLLRMHEGERFALPFKLRPRWPTPPDPPALP
jgi:hypothetical protein